MGFVIHWHESAMDLHVFPILIPPPTSLSTRSLWVFPVYQVRALVSCVQPGLVICFTLDNIHVSMLFSRNIPPSSWCPPFVICVLSPAPFPWLLYGHFPASQNRVNTWKEMGPFHWKIENYECLSLSPNFLKTEDPWVLYSQIYYYNLWVMVASRYIWNFSFFL